jgi:rhodanese-related sulfurtransferase
VSAREFGTVPNCLEIRDCPDFSAILERAAERGRAKGLDYAGELTPIEAWRLFDAGAARIVDVRTRPEWEFVGRVADVPLVEWRRYGAQAPNPHFLRELAELAALDEPILFICRSGVRSHHAAELAARAGYARVFNVLEGFEGDLDASRRRGRLGGWRAADLPWEQS